MERIEDEGEGR